MSTSNISQCAAPYCKNQWHKMGEGKLFCFHRRDLAISGESSSRKVWLCEDHFESWEVTLGREGQVVLFPLLRMAS